MHRFHCTTAWDGEFSIFGSGISFFGGSGRRLVLFEFCVDVGPNAHASRHVVVVMCKVELEMEKENGIDRQQTRVG